MAKKPVKMTKKRIAKLEKKERNKKDFLWKEIVKAEFGGLCIVCGSNKMINVHHIIPREQREFRHLQENGITLCPLHHKWSRVLSAHRNPFEFYELYRAKFPERYKYLFDYARAQRERTLDENGKSN